MPSLNALCISSEPQSFPVPTWVASEPPVIARRSQLPEPQVSLSSIWDSAMRLYMKDIPPASFKHDSQRHTAACTAGSQV